MTYEKPKWLINEEKAEQLEFAQDVIEEMDRYSNQLIDENYQLTQQVAALTAKLAVAVGALEYYTDATIITSWGAQEEADNGKVAREALAALKDGEA